MYWQSMIKDISFATPSPELGADRQRTMPSHVPSVHAAGVGFFPSCLIISMSITTLVDMITLVIANYFYNGLVAVRVGATDWHHRTVDRGRGCISTVNICSSTAAARIVSNARYDEVSNENDRWFGCHGTTEYLLDSNGNEREQANYCYVPSTC